MKLTKGKLSKLFNKKKQSHKKKKNTKKNKKTNTFRRNKRTNLANKTLKKIKIGGDPDEIVPIFPLLLILEVECEPVETVPI